MIQCYYCTREFNRQSSMKCHARYCKENPNHEIKPSYLNACEWEAHNLNELLRLVSSGEIFDRDESVIRRQIKKYLVHVHGHKCMICSRSEWEKQPIPLICDHIDGDSKNNCLENFRNVCPNCDAQLPTFKSKNRGRGRSYDRRYKQLKSKESAI